jgi:hypothetical protein
MDQIISAQIIVNSEEKDNLDEIYHFDVGRQTIRNPMHLEAEKEVAAPLTKAQSMKTLKVKKVVE